MHKKLERKLFNLFTGELTATVLFAILYVMYIDRIEWATKFLTPFSSIFAFVLLEFILLQGSYYWFLKWRQIKQKDFTDLPYSKLLPFVMFKKINLLLIVIGSIVLIYELVNLQTHFYWYLFVFAFAVIEYINYFHIRLSYMSVAEIKEFIRQKGFRSSKLAKELKTIRS